MPGLVCVNCYNTSKIYLFAFFDTIKSLGFYNNIWDLFYKELSDYNMYQRTYKLMDYNTVPENNLVFHFITGYLRNVKYNVKGFYILNHIIYLFWF